MTEKAALISARTAVANARAQVASGEPIWYRKCLKFVRTCWELPAVYATANEAWINAKHRHPFTTENAIPFGAPVFTARPHAPATDAGHVIIAGGYNRKGQRIYRSVDILKPGVVSVVTLDVFREKWGHVVLGWTEDLSGFYLNLPPAPKRRNRK